MFLVFTADDAIQTYTTRAVNSVGLLSYSSCCVML